ncbi:hypothetical protein L596_000116 [Steinernema carpocapsae]|uniref:Neurotransmitter-gated ion-channel ligand-binding domain-containing protein n=1 Tax=Steinernema carpocapsae TaxID=34508 RepID=A0A4U8UI85_STECR|nr:hypothetical protein L596_000116 [Steinernema carpocapsae]
MRFLWLALFGLAVASKDEYRLIQDLREGYDRIERPVEKHHEPLKVELKIILQQIADVVCFRVKCLISYLG